MEKWNVQMFSANVNLINVLNFFFLLQNTVPNDNRQHTLRFKKIQF